MNKEIWKTIVGFEDYQISNLGKVKSFKFGKEKILNKSKDTNGYFKVDFWVYGKRYSKRVHQLVAISFLKHIPSGMELVIDHINNDKLDNRVENLQIVSQRFNSRKNQFSYSSKYKGVCWHKQAKKWNTQITINGERKYLGLFDCEIKASEAYQNAVNNL